MTPPLFGRYARVSTSEQAGPDTSSIDDQLTATARIVEAAGGVLIDTYRDDKKYRDGGGRLVEPSGERADRPEWLRMLADLKAGRINGIAAFHEWRLYRDFRPFVDFIEIARKAKPAVLLVHGQWSEQFAVFGAWMGKADNEHRVAQVMKGRWDKARGGLPLSGYPIFYKTVRDEQGKRLGFVLKDEGRDWLARFAALYIARRPLTTIAAELGAHPITGSKLGTHMLSEIARNPFFYGELAPKWRHGATFVAVGKQEPAWDEPTRAAMRLEVARRAALHKSVPHAGGFLFSGVIRCGLCGRTMSGRSGTKGKIPYYCCALGARQHRPIPSDHGQSHPFNGISERVMLGQLEALGRMMTPELARSLAERFVVPGRGRVGPSPETLAAKRDELAGTQAEYDETPASAARARHFLAGEIGRLSKELASLEAVVAPPEVEISPAAYTSRLLEFFDDRTLDLPLEVLRPKILEYFPVLWVVHGKLSGPPAEMWITPR